VRTANERALLHAGEQPGLSVEATEASDCGGEHDLFRDRVRRLVPRRQRRLYDYLVEARRVTLRPLLALALVNVVDLAEEAATEPDEKRAGWLKAKLSEAYAEARKLAKAERDLNPAPPGAHYQVSVQGVLTAQQMELDLVAARAAGYILDAESPAMPAREQVIDGEVEVEEYQKEQRLPAGTGEADRAVRVAPS
jgi:hypothetical protein